MQRSSYGDFDIFPVEIRIVIFSFLPIKTLGFFSSVNKSIERECDVIWKKYTLKIYMIPSNKTKTPIVSDRKLRQCRAFLHNVCYTYGIRNYEHRETWKSVFSNICNCVKQIDSENNTFLCGLFSALHNPYEYNPRQHDIRHVSALIHWWGYHKILPYNLGMHYLWYVSHDVCLILK
jgi:hypothetical protein